MSESSLSGSLQWRRILGGRKLLVYVRIVVAAIFDSMTRSFSLAPHFLLSFEFSGAFASKNIRAPKENACTADYA